MDITRIISGAILLIIAIWCFTTFPVDLTRDLIIKCIAGSFLSCFGIILLMLALQKRAAMAVLGAILLAFSIFIAMGIPDIAFKCVAVGIVTGLGILMLVYGLKKK